jgi:hypothetical protein
MGLQGASVQRAKVPLHTLKAELEADDDRCVAGAFCKDPFVAHVNGIGGSALKIRRYSRISSFAVATMFPMSFRGTQTG